MSKFYNPKSHAPAVYIPAWLIQVSSDCLSLQAKILYGRLAQWANTKSTVHRSYKQLATELGVDPQVIKRFLAELRDVKLIETYQVELGAENHYRFLDHEWIHADLLAVFDWGKNELTPRVESDPTPGSKVTLPRVESDPPKVKEIKENKKEIKNLCSSDDELNIEEDSFNQFWEAYPRKEAKAAARKAWQKIKQKDYEQIISDIAMRKNNNWKGKDKQYIPLPASYLNGKRWNDELTQHKEHGNDATKKGRDYNIADRLEKRRRDYAESRRRELSAQS